MRSDIQVELASFLGKTQVVRDIMKHLLAEFNLTVCSCQPEKSHFGQDDTKIVPLLQISALSRVGWERLTQNGLHATYIFLTYHPICNY